MDEPLNPTKKAIWDKIQEASAAATAAASNIVSGRVQLDGSGRADVAIAGVVSASNGKAVLHDVGGGVDRNTASYRVICTSGNIRIDAMAVGGAAVGGGSENVSYIVRK